MGQALPAIAAKTYSRLKEERLFRKAFARLQEKLSRLKSPTLWAAKAHEEVDHQLQKDFDHPLIEKLITCRQGCSACCHTQVSSTVEEAALLLHKMEQTGLELDFERLEKQAQTPLQKWYDLTYEERRCLFLGSENSCLLYEDRPSVCRTNYVLSPASSCDTRDGKEKPLRMLKTEHADMAVAAQFKSSKKTGMLPALLSELILAKKNQ